MSIQGIYRFYRDGFRGMTLGRTLWCVVLVKLAIVFGLLRAFYFEPQLRGTPQENSSAVARELTNRT